MADPILELEGRQGPLRYARRHGRCREGREPACEGRRDRGDRRRIGLGQEPADDGGHGPSCFQRQNPQGEADYRGTNLLALSKSELNTIRGRKITMIFQEPMTSLDPLYTIGSQLMEPIMHHQKVGAAEARGRAIDMLKLVKIPEPERRMGSYPHEMSGGQRQRVMIAMALANDPDLLIADEPTTALDVTIQAEILELMAGLQKRLGMGMVFITHDLNIVKRIAHRVYVMRYGEVVEEGDTKAIFANPKHPYTKALLEAEPTGRKAPPPANAPKILDGTDMRVTFKIGGGFLARSAHPAQGRRPRVGDACGRARPSASSASRAPANRPWPAPSCACCPAKARSASKAATSPALDSEADAAPAQAVAGRAAGSLRLAQPAHDGGPDRHRGPAGARAFDHRRSSAIARAAQALEEVQLDPKLAQSLPA